MKERNQIRKVDLDVSSNVRASSSVSTFHSAIEEVVLNSIDAGSQSISITLDFNTFSFEVKDNGMHRSLS
jgi:DNA mismatch repair ATPase MutL